MREGGPPYEWTMGALRRSTAEHDAVEDSADSPRRRYLLRRSRRTRRIARNFRRMKLTRKAYFALGADILRVPLTVGPVVWLGAGGERCDRDDYSEGCRGCIRCRSST